MLSPHDTGNGGSGGFAGGEGPATNVSLSPVGLAIDVKNDDLVIAALSDGVLLRVSATTGLISSITGKSPYIPWRASGDGGPASQASALSPYGVMFDAAGNLYFSDQSAGTIRQISASSGIVKTIAGQNGYTKTSGDGGRALNATFYAPRWLAMDSAGTIYVTDYNRIRRLTCASNIPGPQSANPLPVQSLPLSLGFEVQHLGYGCFCICAAYICCSAHGICASATRRCSWACHQSCQPEWMALL